MIKLGNIFGHVHLDKKNQNILISGICEDTRCVTGKELFFVTPRKKIDIFSYLPQIEDKVAAFVARLKDKKKMEKTVTRKPVIYVNEIDKEFYRSIDAIYGFDNKDFNFIGVTGTKGKTTVTHLVYEILKNFRQRAALIGTVHYCVGVETLAAPNTTPGYLALRKLLELIRKAKGRFVVMEVSSHGIAQDRIKNLAYQRCVFTNLSREHLDYHKTMQEYFSTKREFFLRNRNAVAVINCDDKYGRKLIAQVGKSISYGIDREADFKASKIVLSRSGVSFTLAYKHLVFQVKSPLVGRHNVLNILAAIATVHSLGFSLQDTVEYVQRFTGVEGRLEEVSSDIFVDYAHTPDSLKKTLSALREIGYKKVICVFGCGGNRDKGKRRLMGQIASTLADFTFITSDNPRDEDQTDICEDIKRGFAKNNFSVVTERRKAIQSGLRLQKRLRHSCLIVAGKGHEAYQIIQNQKIPFKDSQVIKELVRQC